MLSSGLGVEGGSGDSEREVHKCPNQAGTAKEVANRFPQLSTEVVWCFIA
jgi:hypothetical protein